MGDIGCFSFYPTKNLGAAGEGGMLTTNNPEYARMAALLRSWGEEQRYRPRLKGFNYRLPSLQAAILRVKLPRLEHGSKRGALERPNMIVCSKTPASHGRKPWRIRGMCIVSTRFARRIATHCNKGLEAAGIQTAVHYPLPIHLMPAYADSRYKAGDFPVAEACAKTVLSLPLHSHLSARAGRRSGRASLQISAAKNSRNHPFLTITTAVWEPPAALRPPAARPAPPAPLLRFISPGSAVSRAISRASSSGPFKSRIFR